jgi:hypothetical protein
VLGGVALAAVLAARRPGAPTSTRPGRPNVVLVTLDTVRADHLGCYGAARAATPTLDALAASGVRFATAVAHAPLTAPSHASILTSRTPLGHGVRDNGAYVLPEGVRTVAEEFRHAGYKTAAFVSGFPLTRRFGLDRGFETYDDHLPRGSDPRRTAVRRAQRRPHHRRRPALARRPRAPPSPSSCGSITSTPTRPTSRPPSSWRVRARPMEARSPSWTRSWPGSCAASRAGRRRDARWSWSPADHGESLGEHGEDTHGIFLYDATLRVPFLLAGPDVPAGRVATTVARGIDVAPTLLDYAGLAMPAMEGRSLRPAASGGRLEDAPTYSESLHPQLQYGWAPLHSLRTERYKMIEAPRPELYDLQADAAETADRAAADPSRLEGLRRELQKMMATNTPVAARAIDAETAARLDALGYIGTGGGTTAPVPTGRDPKDGIGLATRLGRNGMSVARTEPQKAIRELTALLAEDPGMLVVLRTRAVAYETAGQYEAAVRDLRTLEGKGALSAEDAVVLGDSLRLAGRGGRGHRRARRDGPEEPALRPALALPGRGLRRPEADGRGRQGLRQGPGDHAGSDRGLARPGRPGPDPR